MELQGALVPDEPGTLSLATGAALRRPDQISRYSATGHMMASGSPQLSIQSVQREGTADGTIADESPTAGARRQAHGSPSASSSANEPRKMNKAGNVRGGRGVHGASPGLPENRPDLAPQNRANAPPLVKSKLTLHYEEGEQPMSELLRLGGGQGMHVIVEAVAENSKAMRAGIKAGFALVSMNGRNEFMQLPGWQVRLLLDAPITLGFDPEPVRPQSVKCTEIRLTRAQEILGIPPKVAVCGPKDSGMLAEEIIFKPNSAPLWISAWGDEMIGGRPGSPERAGSVPRVYELRRPEAHAIVGHAIRGARESVSPDRTWEAMLGNARPPKRTWPAAPICSLDCVAECIDHDAIVERMQAEKASQAAAPQAARSSAAASMPDPPGSARAFATRPSAEGSRGPTRSRPPAATRKPDVAPGLGTSAEREDRSPLRWIGQVMEPILSTLSPRRSAASPEPPGFARGGTSPRSPRRGSPKPVGARGDNQAVEDYEHAPNLSTPGLSFKFSPNEVPMGMPGIAPSIARQRGDAPGVDIFLSDMGSCKI